MDKTVCISGAMFLILLFAASPGSTGGSSRFIILSQRNTLYFKGLSSGSRSLGLCCPGCVYFYGAQVLRWEEDKEQQTKPLQGSGFCVRASRWLMWVSFAALIAVVHRCLQVNTFALLSFSAFVCQLFPSTCQQMLSHQPCSSQPFPLSPS